MSELPKYFPPTGANAVASYSYSDIASGTGYTRYEGFNTIQIATKDHHLKKDTVFSDSIYTTGVYSETAPAWQKCIDVDFDLTAFKFPQTIKGTAIVQFTWGAQGVGGAAINTYCVAKLRKYSGTTETELGSGQKGNTSNVYTSPAAGNWTTWSGTVKIEIDETLFGVGDILRLTMEVWGQGGNGSVNTLLIAHSPQNDTVASILDPGASADQLCRYTFLRVDIPYNIDV